MFPLNHIGTKLINENHKIPEKTILVNSFEQKLDHRSLNSPCIHCIISEILKKILLVDKSGFWTLIQLPQIEMLILIVYTWVCHYKR